MDKQPRVSIVLPFYNASACLRRALTSALNQADVCLEVIAIDDGSEDGSHDVVQQIGDARVSLIRLEQNNGVATARNKGLKRARGEWVQFLDADDYLQPGKLSMQLRHSEGADFCSCDWLEIDEAGGEWHFRPTINPTNELACMILEGNNLPIHVPLVRRELIEKAGGFDPEVELEDWDLWLKVALRNPRYRYVKILGAVYMKHSGSRSYDRYESALMAVKYLRSLEGDKRLSAHHINIQRIIRNKYFDLALQATVMGDRYGATEWIGLSSPHTVMERLEIAVADSPLAVAFVKRIPGPNKLKRLIKGWWYSRFGG